MLMLMLINIYIEINIYNKRIEKESEIELKRIEKESEEIELKRFEKESEIELKRIESEVELKRIEKESEVELKRIEFQIEKINLEKIQAGQTSSSNAYASSSRVKKESAIFVQLYRDTLLSTTSSAPDLSKFGHQYVNIIRTDSTNENDICFQFSNIFNKALEKERFNYGIFSSEENKWLLDPSKNIKYKPDLFMSNRALTEPKANKLRKSIESAIPYFTEHVKFIFEGKIETINEEHLGKLIYYLKLMNNVQPVSYGFIFNASNFFYMESTAGSITKIEEGTFTSPGAYDYILFNIKNSKIPIIELYDDALKQFSDSLFLDTSSPFSFIGSGKYGKVFSCVINDSSCSLKLIKLGSGEDFMDFEEVQTELKSFREVYKLDNTITFKSYENPLRFDSKYGSIGAYLLEGIGTRAKFNQSRNIIERLYDLHKLKVIHGDPRLPNILNFKSNLCWIDFRYGLPFTEDNIVTDVKILMHNLLGNNSEKEIESKTDTIKEYAQESLKNNENALKILLSLFNKKK